MATNNKAAGGCISALALIFIIPAIIKLLETIVSKIVQLLEIIVSKFIQLVEFLIPFAIAGAVGYVIYLLIQYNRRTRKIEMFFEWVFRLNHISKKVKRLEQEEIKSLEAPNEESFITDLEQLKDQVYDVKRENAEIKNNRQRDIDDAVRKVAVEIDQQNKKHILNDFFGESSGDYARSDEFEKQSHQEKLKKEQEDIENRSFQLEVNEQLFEQDKRIYENYQEAKEDRYKIRVEMNEGFAQINQALLNLEKNVISLQGYVNEKFNQLEIRFFQEIAMVKELVSNLRIEIKQEMSDMKVQFGREIVRLDKQQIQIVGKLEEYSNKVKAYSYELIKCKNDCQQMSNRSEHMLNQANNIYHRHQTDIKLLSKDLDMGLRRMALVDASFSNKVGQAKNLIDAKSQDIHFALKDMGYERIGINMLRQEHEQRHNVEQQKMQNLIQQQRHLEERIRAEQSRSREVAGLQHQLYVTNENLQYTRNRASLMQQEHNVMRRLSR